MLKKSLAMILVVVLAFTLAACGNGDSSGSDNELGGELTVVAPLTEPHNSGWVAVLDKFAEETGVTIHTDFLPWMQLRERQTLELASGSGSYDVVYAHPLWWREFAGLGYLQPVDNYTTAEDLALFIPSLLEMYRADDGLVYGLPDWISCIMIAYRVDLFEEHGLSKPETFADWVRAAEILHTDDRAGIAFPAINAAGLAGSYLTALLANNSWIVDDNDNPTMNTPEALETMRFFEQLGHFAPPGIANFHWEEVFAAGLGDRAAIAMMLSIRIAEFNDPAVSQTAGLWDYAVFREKSAAAAIDSWIWSVATDSKNQFSAGELVKFLASTDSQITMSSINQGTAGATFEFYERPEVEQYLPFLPAMSAAVAENSRAMPDWVTWTSEMDMLEISMQRMFLGEMTPEEVCAAVQEIMVANRS